MQWHQVESNTRYLLKDSSNSRWKTISFNFWVNQIQYLLKKQWEHVENQMHCLNLTWVGFLGVCFTGKIIPHPELTPCLELIRIMLKTWNLVCKYINICGFRKYAFSHQGPLDFANISISLQKKTGNNTTFTQNNIHYFFKIEKWKHLENHIH